MPAPQPVVEVFGAPLITYWFLTIRLSLPVLVLLDSRVGSSVTGKARSSAFIQSASAVMVRRKEPGSSSSSSSVTTPSETCPMLSKRYIAGIVNRTSSLSSSIKW